MTLRGAPGGHRRGNRHSASYLVNSGIAGKDYARRYAPPATLTIFLSA
jgi:hypothetical protein